jgi:hypothetical protein
VSLTSDKLTQVRQTLSSFAVHAPLALRGCSIGELAFFSLADSRHRLDRVGHMTQKLRDSAENGQEAASTGLLQKNTGREK